MLVLFSHIFVCTLLLIVPLCSCALLSSGHVFLATRLTTELAIFSRTRSASLPIYGLARGASWSPALEGLLCQCDSIAHISGVTDGTCRRRVGVSVPSVRLELSRPPPSAFLASYGHVSPTSLVASIFDCGVGSLAPTSLLSPRPALLRVSDSPGQHLLGHWRLDFARLAPCSSVHLSRWLTDAWTLLRRLLHLSICSLALGFCALLRYQSSVWDSVTLGLCASLICDVEVSICSLQQLCAALGVDMRIPPQAKQERTVRGTSNLLKLRSTSTGRLAALACHLRYVRWQAHFAGCPLLLSSGSCVCA